jgi:membrane-bound lytic murein transglycosylase B
MKMRIFGGAIIAIALSLAGTGWAEAQQKQQTCRNTGSFERWLADFKKEALAQGLSPRAYARAEHLLTYDARTIGIDR